MLSQAEINPWRKYFLSPELSATYAKILPVADLAIRQVLSANVRARMRGRTQAELAAHMRKTEAWASNFLLNKNAIPVVRLPALAEFCGCTVADLFVVHESNTGTRSDIPRDPQSADAEVGLPERLAAAEEENARLRADARAYGEALIELADSEAGAITKRAPRRGGHRRPTR